MGWKLRKDKLRADAETTPDAPPPLTPDTPPPAAEAAAPDTDEITLNPLPHETASEHVLVDVPEVDLPPVVFDLDPTAFVPLSSVPDDEDDADAPPPQFAAFDAIALPPGGEDDAIALSADGETEADEGAAFDPLSFAPASDLDDAPVFGLDSVYEAETDDNAPVFAMGTDSEDDAPVFAMGTDSGDPLPDDAQDAPVLAMGTDAADTSDAFAPYQPDAAEAMALGTTADADTYDDPDMEVGAMAFNPQSPDLGTFSSDAPTAGEEIADAEDPAFADTADTTADTAAPMAFEPSFEAPDALAGASAEVDSDDAETDPNAPFMDRDALAAGLVSVEAATGLPRVAPFVLPGEQVSDFGAEPSGPHSLVVRLGSLSATYALVKPVTTIGRPDTETHTYPDIEVDLDDGVSRHHAEVRLEDDTAYLVDVGSTNGTILNGTLLTPDQPTPLQHGDRIRIGERVEITFE